MSDIFNYQTIKVQLQKKTRSLFITLNNQETENSISMETLFELESLLAWCTSKVEIHSIFIQSNSAYFSKGYDNTVLKKLSVEKLSKFTKKLQKINQAIQYLPQTVIIDLQLGAKNIAAELATACDIRIANRACEIVFDHSKMGLIPCSGGIAQLSQLVGHGNAKNWLLSACSVRLNTLQNSGFVYDTYTMENRQSVINKLLKNIFEQAPVQRIQTKLGIIETVRNHTENMLGFENKIAQASMISEDWKESHHDHMPAKNMKEAVKLTLVKSNQKGEEDISH